MELSKIGRNEILVNTTALMMCSSRVPRTSWHRPGIADCLVTVAAHYISFDTWHHRRQAEVGDAVGKENA